MKRFCPLSYFLAALVWLWMGKALCLQAQQPPVQPSKQPPDPSENTEAIERLIRWYRALERGRFQINGEIVDDQGKRLSNVHIKYPKSRSAEEMAKLDAAWLSRDPTRLAALRRPESDLYEELISKDGTFNVDIKNCAVMSAPFVFQLQGYYLVTTNYGIPAREHDELSKLLDGRLKTVPQEVLRRETIRIVLEKQGTLTKLEQRFVQLEVSSEVSKGVQIAPAPQGLTMKPISIPTPAKALPERSLMIQTEQDPDGKISILEIRDRSPFVGKVPRSLKLTLTGSDSGFIRFSPKGDKPFQRQMKTAPETGYQNQLVLTGDDLRAWYAASRSGRAYYDSCFFFKIGKDFGRGYFSGLQVADDHSKVEAFWSLLIQPDGSRNLETGE